MAISVDIVVIIFPAIDKNICLFDHWYVHNDFDFDNSVDNLEYLPIFKQYLSRIVLKYQRILRDLKQ